MTRCFRPIRPLFESCFGHGAMAPTAWQERRNRRRIACKQGSERPPGCPPSPSGPPPMYRLPHFQPKLGVVFSQVPSRTASSPLLVDVATTDGAGGLQVPHCLGTRSRVRGGYADGRFGMVLRRRLIPEQSGGEHETPRRLRDARQRTLPHSRTDAETVRHVLSAERSGEVPSRLRHR